VRGGSTDESLARPSAAPLMASSAADAASGALASGVEVGGGRKRPREEAAGVEEGRETPKEKEDENEDDDTIRCDGCEKLFKTEEERESLKCCVGDCGKRFCDVEGNGEHRACCHEHGKFCSRCEQFQCEQCDVNSINFCGKCGETYCSSTCADLKPGKGGVLECRSCQAWFKQGKPASDFCRKCGSARPDALFCRCGNRLCGECVPVGVCGVCDAVACQSDGCRSELDDFVFCKHSDMMECRDCHSGCGCGGQESGDDDGCDDRDRDRGVGRTKE